MDPVFAHVGHCDNDERLDNFGANEAFRCLVDTPFDATKRSGGIKYILSVVQIQNWITSPRKSPVTGRQIHQNIAPVPEKLRMEMRDAV